MRPLDVVRLQDVVLELLLGVLGDAVVQRGVDAQTGALWILDAVVADELIEDVVDEERRALAEVLAVASVLIEPAW